MSLSDHSKPSLQPQSEGDNTYKAILTGLKAKDSAHPIVLLLPHYEPAYIELSENDELKLRDQTNVTITVRDAGKDSLGNQKVSPVFPSPRNLKVSVGDAGTYPLGIQNFSPILPSPRYLSDHQQPSSSPCSNSNLTVLSFLQRSMVKVKESSPLAESVAEKIANWLFVPPGF